MKVAMYYKNSDVRIEEMAKPVAGPGELIVKVIACGICGSDVLEWYRIKRAPLVLGHEIVGEIEEVGSGAGDWRIGERVIVSHHVPCNTCRYCFSGHHTACDTLHTTNVFPGGFSEYIRVPKINVDRGVLRLPAELTFEDGTFIEPLGTVVRGQRLANLTPGQSVLVLGSGIAGSLHIKLARALGAGRIISTDIEDSRLQAARRFGADATISALDDVPMRVRELNNGRGADLVIICAGSLPAAMQGIHSVDRGGTVLFFAVPKPGEDVMAPMNELWRNEVKLMTSYAASPTDLNIALELIRSGRVNVHDMITHRLPLSESALGFRLAAEAKQSLKVIIEPFR